MKSKSKAIVWSVSETRANVWVLHTVIKFTLVHLPLPKKVYYNKLLM